MLISPVTGPHEPLQVPWLDCRACGQHGRQLDTQEMYTCSLNRQREHNHIVPSYSGCDNDLLIQEFIYS